MVNLPLGAEILAISPRPDIPVDEMYLIEKERGWKRGSDGCVYEARQCNLTSYKWEKKRCI